MKPTVTIDLQVAEVISYAGAYNGVPIVGELTIAPAQGEVLVDLQVTVSLTSLDEEWAEPWRQAVPHLGPAGMVWGAQSFRTFTPNVNRLLEQRELRRAEFTVVISQGNNELARAVVPVMALAASSWVAARPLKNSAATMVSFVQPQEPELAGILTKASDALVAAGHSPGLEGYQSDDPARIDQLVDAVYETVRARGISYANPPAGWDLKGNPETEGQRIRLPGEVLREVMATCLDSTVLMASLMEAIGLRPLIIVIPGHAFVGYWRYDRGVLLDGGPAGFTDPVVPLRDALSDLDAGRIAFIETTTLCGGEHSHSASDARIEARSRLESAPLTHGVAAADYAVVVDVVEVRVRRTMLPLPVRASQADGTVSVIEYRGQALTLDLISQAIAKAGAGTAAGVLSRDAPPRMKRWQDALLDLSRRNPLLNYRFPERSSVSLFVSERALGSVEDLLQSGATIQLAPAPDLGNGNLLRLGARRTTPAEHEEQLTNELVANRRVLTTLSANDFSTRLRRMMTNSRSVIAETGSNGLYLAMGMVAWAPQGHQAEHYAPLILVPVVLKPSDRNRRFALEIDVAGAVTPNFSLAERLKQEFGLDLPGLVEPETDDAGVDIDGLIAYMRQQFLAAGLRDFRVDAACSLGFFDFSTYRLWRDLSEHWPTFLKNSPLVRHLTETPTQMFSDTTSSASSGSADGSWGASPGNYAENHRETDERTLDDFAATLPVVADASQALAVRQAMEGTTFVLQGPPGSGKSQTITNLLARALHSGQRVLFVAEKPGALGVVRNRLAAVGLGAFGLNLHDKGMRPADVRRQLREALDAAAATDRIGFDAAQRDIDRAITPLRQYPERLHAVGSLGESAYSARNKLLAVPTDAELPVPASFISSVDQQTVEDVRRSFRDARDVVARAGSAQSNAWSFTRTAQSELSPERRQELLLLVEGAVNGYSAVKALPSARTYIDTLESWHELEVSEALADRTIDLTLVDAASSPAATQARQHVLDTIDGFAPEKLFAGAGPRTIEAPVGELRSAAEQALASFFIGRKKRVGAVVTRLRECLSEDSAVDRDSLVATVNEIERIQTLSKDYVDFVRTMPGVFVPPGANLLVSTDRDAILDHVRVVAGDVEIARADGTPRSQRIRDLISSGATGASAVGNFTRALRALFSALESDSSSLDLWRGHRSIGETLTSSVNAWRDDAHDRDFLAFRRWLELRALFAPLEERGLSAAVQKVSAGEVPSHEVDMAFERGYLTSLLRKQLDDQALDAFDGARHDSLASDFAMAADTLRTLSPGVLADDMISSRGFQPGAAIGAVGELRRELGKQRGFKPIRRLLREHWNVISRVTPLVLAVPDALVRFVDGDLEPFDLVVFDEASQIKVAHAIGALGRGKAAVIVGDSKQMPPSSVAQMGSSEFDESDESEQDVIPRDEESILTESLRAWVPETYLTWHYRSEDETLIAFSNRTYYDGRLSTLPAPTTNVENKGLSFTKVDGAFVKQSRGANVARGGGVLPGTNRAEAEAIVAEVVRRVHDPVQSRFSIGVVTLNRPQQDLVQNLLLSTDDEAVIAALNPEEGDEPLTVWNLETVQGHERDVILFSIAFSKDEKGVLSRNFGPLVHAGGERRLNVAVTRARRQVIVFCSFEPEDLRTEGMSEGLQQLAEYLRLAKYGPGASGATGSAPISAPDRHREEIAAALRERGVRVETQVGLSEFKVDIAVSRTAPEGTWSVGILTDGEAWRARATVGDRDSLPVVLLSERMGWPVVSRVWTPDWLRDRTGVLDRLEMLVDQVESGTLEAKAPVPRKVPTVDSATIAQQPERAAPAALVTDAPAAPAWVEWEPDTRQPGWFLDQLHDAQTRAYLVDVVRSIIATEGPVLAARAARLIGRLHGLDRVRDVRLRAIGAAIGNALQQSSDGFYFLASAGPDDFDGWAVAEAGVRKIDEISLAEISNAMSHVARVGLGASREELITASASALGFLRVTSGIRTRLEAAVTEGVRRGALRAEGAYFVAPDKTA